MMQYYILPTHKDLQHHGVLGMKWGIRRYQSYETVPRKSGETGVEKIAKKDISKANKKLKKYYKSFKYNTKAVKYATKGYKKSIKLGNADGNNNSYMTKAKKYANKTKKMGLKGGVSYKDLSIASPELRIKYETGLLAMNKARSKYKKTKLKYNSKYGDTYVSKLIDVA